MSYLENRLTDLKERIDELENRREYYERRLKEVCNEDSCDDEATLESIGYEIDNYLDEIGDIEELLFQNNSGGNDNE